MKKAHLVLGAALAVVFAACRGGAPSGRAPTADGEARRIGDDDDETRGAPDRGAGTAGPPADGRTAGTKRVPREGDEQRAHGDESAHPAAHPIGKAEEASPPAHATVEAAVPPAGVKAPRSTPTSHPADAGAARAAAPPATDPDKTAHAGATSSGSAGRATKTEEPAARETRPDGSVEALVVPADGGAPSKKPSKAGKVLGSHTAAELAALTADEPDGGSPDAPAFLNAPKVTRHSRSTSTPGPLPIAGGPVAVAGADIDFDPTRVERFVEEGGVIMDGRLLDADSHNPVANARLEAWMGTRSLHAVADAGGRFRFEGLVPGSRITLWITSSPTYVQERTEVVIPAQKTKFESDFNLLGRATVPGGHEGGIGVFLSRRGTHTVVNGLVAFGPAERAGLKTGDVIMAVGPRTASNLGPGGVEYLLSGPIGSEVELTVQTGTEPPRKATVKRGGR